MGLQRNRHEFSRRYAMEQKVSIGHRREHLIGHAIVQQRQHAGSLRITQRLKSSQGIGDAALYAQHGMQAAVARDVRRFRRPRR